MAWFLTQALQGVLFAGLGLAVLFWGTRWFSELAAGVLLGLVAALSVSLPSEDLVGGSDVSFLGTVREVPRRATTGQVVFEVDAQLGGTTMLVRCRGVDLPWRNSAHLVVGATVWVRGSLEPVIKPLNPFSWSGWLWRRGIAAECKALFISRPVMLRDDVMAALRDVIQERSFALTDSHRGIALLLSMALGYRDVLSPSVEHAFSSLGLTHLLVVSGYQVSMVFGVVMALAVRGVPRTSRFRYWREGCTALGLILAILYVVLIGSEMSAVRALLAATFLCSERLVESKSGFAQRWGVALLLMQLLSPYSMFDIGVILTFAALAGIGIGTTIGGDRKFVTWVSVTCSVWALTSVVVTAWNGTVSLLSIPLNLTLAAPWSALNCTLGLVALAGSLVGLPGSSYALSVVVWSNTQLSEGMMWIAQSSWAGWKLAGVARWMTCGALCAVSLVLAALAIRAKNREV